MPYFLGMENIDSSLESSIAVLGKEQRLGRAGETNASRLLEKSRLQTAEIYKSNFMSKLSDNQGNFINHEATENLCGLSQTSC